MRLSEDASCYTSTTQRDVLVQIALDPTVGDHFFLTGGTALSVFYLHHRSSEDLDFFSIDEVELSALSFSIRTEWPYDHVLLRSTPRFLSLLVKGVKVEFVLDPLSNKGERQRFSWQSSGSLEIDTIENIASNKLCTMVSRQEPKDFVDFYAVCRDVSELEISDVYAEARWIALADFS